MASYSSLLGKRVEVLYRAGDIFLPAIGTLAADTGKSVFLEEQYTQQGKTRNFSWEIPYGCISRLEESRTPAPPEPVVEPEIRHTETAKGAIEIFALKHRPKEA